jgi:hypothetical protein
MRGQSVGGSHFNAEQPAKSLRLEKQKIAISRIRYCFINAID